MEEQLIQSFASKTNYSRRELKYYISDFQYRQLMKIIPNYMLPDENTKDIVRNSYPVRSLYLESKDLKCYNERLDGVKVRAKYRYRAYSEEKHDKKAEIFVEIKKKMDKDLYKRRVKLRLNDLHNVLERGQDYDFSDSANMSPEEIKTLNDFLYLKSKFKLSSFIGIRYEREAYYDKMTSRLRLSFDRNMYAKACPSIFGLYESLDYWKKVPLRNIVFEIKTRSALPQWMTGLVKRFSLVGEPISKYCMSVKALGLQGK